MKTRVFAVACLTGAFVCAAAAQPASHPQWVGVWESKLDGQPGATLTLAQDTGELGGTLVLNIIMKDGAPSRVAASEPHVLVNPRVDGNTLFFGVRKIDGSGALLNFTVALTPEGKARIHCVNCGNDAPIVDMERQWQ
jgi:hypothetical protein